MSEKVSLTRRSATEALVLLADQVQRLEKERDEALKERDEARAVAFDIANMVSHPKAWERLAALETLYPWLLVDTSPPTEAEIADAKQLEAEEEG